MKIDWAWFVSAVEDFLASASAKPRCSGPTVSMSCRLPSFYQEPSPPWAMAESRDLCHASPELSRRYGMVKSEYSQMTGKTLSESCVWRSAERQHEHFLNKKTRIDGISIRSQHNYYPSRAVDCFVVGPDGKADWNPRMYDPLGPLCQKHGLVWGGTWKGKFFGPDGDYPHIELPAGTV